MNKTIYCIILADSVENNSWPLLSHAEIPKQFIDTLYIGKTSLQTTYEQFSDFIPHENFMVVTGKSYKNLVLEQLPMLKPKQVLTELYYRNTAPSIAYATYKIYQQDKDAIIAVAHSDKYMSNKIEFAKQMQILFDYAADNDALITLGFTPTFPATNQYYLQVEETDNKFGRIQEIHQAPDLEKAQQFVTSPNYLWGSGIFVWPVKSIKTTLERGMPNIALRFASIEEKYDTPHEQIIVNKIYEDCDNIELSNLVGKADNLYAYRSSFNYNDINSCKSPQNNIADGKEKSDILSNDNNELSIHSNNYFTEELDGEKKAIIEGDYIIIDKNNDITVFPKKGKYIRSLKTCKALTLKGEIDWNDIRLIKDFHKVISLNFAEVLKVKRMLFNAFPHDSVTKMKRLKEIVISGYATIDSLAIVECKSLERIIIPKTTSTINIGIVYNCKNFKEYIVDKGNPYFITVDGALLSKDGKKLVSVPCGTKETYTVPDSVTYIARGAFFGCKQLNTVVCDFEKVAIDAKAFMHANKIKIIK
jgi:mannose-1-phosphate guanylyltransferase